MGTSPVESVDMFFNKCTLGVSKRSCNLAVRGELGRFPITIDIILSSLKYFSHILQSTSDFPLLGLALQESKTIDQKEVFSWFTFVKKIAKNLKLDLSSECNGKAIKHDLQTKFICFWKSEMVRIGREGGKLDFYSKFKSHFVMEDYLKLIKSRATRSSFSKLRISDHKLEVERGRYLKPKTPRSERFCKHCFDIYGQTIVGDEVHFLLDCPNFKTLRAPLLAKLPKSLFQYDKFRQFQFIINAEGTILKEASVMIHEAFSSF